MPGQPVNNTRPYIRFSPSFLGMFARMTSQLNVALIRKLPGPSIYLAYFFDMLSAGVGTTRYLQTSGRLVQEFNICTGDIIILITTNHIKQKKYECHESLV